MTKAAIATVGEGDKKHDVAHKDFIGQDAAVLARAAGKSIAPEVELVFGETDESNPFVPVEQMMPFVPFVRCRNVDEAIEKARLSEHGFRHTAIIHSTNVHNMTKMGKALDTTLFVKNGPCMAGLGQRRRGIRFVLDRRSDRRGRDHAADLHPRATLHDGRRPAYFGKMNRCISAVSWAVPRATVKHPSMEGWKLLLVMALQADGRTVEGDPILVVDSLGAGKGELVMITSDGIGTRSWWAARTRPSAGPCWEFATNERTQPSISNAWCAKCSRSWALRSAEVSVGSAKGQGSEDRRQRTAEHQCRDSRPQRPRYRLPCPASWSSVPAW